MRVTTARRATITAAVVTAPTGVALLAAPAVAKVAGLPPAVGRAIGVADVVVAVGLLAGRPLWPWAAARAVANVPTAAALARAGTPVGRAAAAVLLVLTCLDAVAARTLHAQRR